MLRLALRTTAALLALAAVTCAQDEPPEEAPTDPYTRGESEALEALGYVRLGHNTWGDRHDTRRIEEDLGRVPFAWIETAHFKLGCNLPAQDIPRDKDDRKKLREELERLAEKLPRLKPRSVRELDPWLRAHLFAMRLEEQYAEFLEIAGVTDDVFPPADAPFYPKDAPAEQKWMGRGPYLGVKGKFLVLLCEKPSSCGRYLGTYTGAPSEMPSRWYFPETDCFLFASAQGFSDGAFRSDRAMHAHVAFNLTHCFVDAYRGYSYQVQAWWKEGLAHRFRRAVSEEHNNYSAIDDKGKRAYTTFDWDVKVRQRAEHGLVRPLSEILDAMDCVGFDLIDHAACWSRVCWMVDEHEPAKFALFLDSMKGLIDAQGFPPEPDVLARKQREALDAAFGGDPDEIDARWMAWMRKEYRGR